VKILHRLPIPEKDGEVSTRDARIRVRANQIIVWVSLRIQQALLAPIPAVLDTGSNYSFACLKVACGSLIKRVCWAIKEELMMLMKTNKVAHFIRKYCFLVKAYLYCGDNDALKIQAEIKVWIEAEVARMCSSCLNLKP